jgi:hypothetical protein
VSKSFVDASLIRILGKRLKAESIVAAKINLQNPMDKQGKYTNHVLILL